MMYGITFKQNTSHFFSLTHGILVQKEQKINGGLKRVDDVDIFNCVISILKRERKWIFVVKIV